MVKQTLLHAPYIIALHQRKLLLSPLESESHQFSHQRF